MKPSKPGTLYSKPFYSTLFQRIGTFLGQLNIKLLKVITPAHTNIIDAELEFRERHAKNLIGRVELFFMKCEGKSIDHIDAIYKEQDREWRAYAAQINKFNKVHKLLPEAFQNIAMERWGEFIAAERNVDKVFSAPKAPLPNTLKVLKN